MNQERQKTDEKLIKLIKRRIEGAADPELENRQARFALRHTPRSRHEGYRRDSTGQLAYQELILALIHN